MLVTGQLHAAGSPFTKCAIAKNKAASKKIAAKLKCWQKAYAGAPTADPSCLSAAEEKFTLAIASAEKKGGCVVTGDASAIEGAVDSCVTSVVTLTPATTTMTLPDIACCSFAGTTGAACLWNDAASCQNLNGTRAAGVCDSVTGGCNATAQAGPCCQIPADASGDFSCFAGLAVNTNPTGMCLTTNLGFGAPAAVTGVCTASNAGCQ